MRRLANCPPQFADVKLEFEFKIKNILQASRQNNVKVLK